MLKRISSAQVGMGMYVHAFDGNWMAHAFWRAHFIVSNDDHIARIRASRSQIVIDTSKGRDVHVPKQPSVPLRPSARFGRADQVRVTEIAEQSTSVLKSFFDECRFGRNVDTSPIVAAVDDVAHLIGNSFAAFMSITRLRDKDNLTYRHSVAVCALMISIGRELGQSPESIRDLGLSGFLHDVGKIYVSSDILQKEGLLSLGELDEVKKHPALGHELLSTTPGIPPVVLDVCLHHHERLDGTGYPFGLDGQSISLAARIAGICDVYDALTSVRPYKDAMSPLDALTLMDTMTGQFDDRLLFTLMRLIGVYPVGKLVRISGHRLAVVVPARSSELGPVFRVFYSTADSRFVPYEDLVFVSGHGSNDMTPEMPSAWFSDAWDDLVTKILSRTKL